MGRATARMVWTRSDPFQTSSFRRGVASIFFSLACCRRRAANGPRIAISLGKFAFFASPGDARPWTRNRSRATVRKLERRHDDRPFLRKARIRRARGRDRSGLARNTRYRARWARRTSSEIHSERDRPRIVFENFQKIMLQKFWKPIQIPFSRANDAERGRGWIASC